jgi:hypothetical protein
MLTTALAALVTGGALLGLVALARVTAAWRADLRVVLTLDDEAGRAGGENGVATAARAVAGAAEIRFVSSAEALDDLRRYLGPAAAGLDRLPTNPVPARVEVVPAARLDAVALQRLVEALGALPGVEDVQAAIGWVAPAERAERALRVAGLGLGGALAVAAVLAIAAGTALARTRRDAGRPAEPRAGLVLQATVLGAAGAALGAGVLVLASDVAAPWTGRLVRESLGLLPLPAPGGALVAALLGGGALAGLVAGLVGSRA